MKNIEVGSVKHLVLQIIIMIIAGIILFPIFDLLYYKFITHSQFVYTVSEYIVEPIIFGVIAGTVLWVSEKMQTKKEK